MSRVLEIALLRTFVLLVEEKSVTRVARRLNRTQPAISLQIKRLEEAAGFPLFEADLRHLRLSRHGEMLLPHARTMLRLDEEARLRLAAEDVEGRVTLGCPDLYAAFLLPETLARFRSSYPGVEVTVRCALSRVLAEDMNNGLVDIAIATRIPGVGPRVGTAAILRAEPLVWLGAVGGVAYQADPLPIATLPDGNLYRDYALAALDKVGRRWRIACISESLAGLQAMALADAAICVLAQSVHTPGLTELGTGDGLPALEGVDLALWQLHPGNSPAADHLAAHIRRSVS